MTVSILYDETNMVVHYPKAIMSWEDILLQKSQTSWLFMYKTDKFNFGKDMLKHLEVNRQGIHFTLLLAGFGLYYIFFMFTNF